MMSKPKNIEENSQLLKGIGASSWFHISEEGRKYRIKRYSEKGELECSRIFSVNDSNFDINTPFEFTYISHCKECTILQNNKVFIFKTKDYEY